MNNFSRKEPKDRKFQFTWEVCVFVWQNNPYFKKNYNNFTFHFIILGLLVLHSSTGHVS